MGRATDIVLRQKIVASYKKGLRISELSRAYAVSRRSIYNYIKLYDESGEGGLKPSYSNCGRKSLTSSDLPYRVVRCFRTWHPNWGADKIRAEILRLRPKMDLPQVRTIHRWLVQNGQVKKRTKLPSDHKRWAKSLHEGWQVDAKEDMKIGDDSKNCWLNIVDEHSGTVISPPIFSQKKDL
jgi:transposase